MSRFLFAWEIGGGLGHIGHLAPLAQVLHAAGHDVTIAVRDLRVIAAIDPGAGIRIMQAPFCVHTYEGLADPPLSYSEVLMRYGYLDKNLLPGMVRAWRELMRATSCDVLVADYSPTALLAARTLNVRSVIIGNAFTIPPFVSPLPNMRPWLKLPPQRLADSDRHVLDMINPVLAQFGAPALTHIHELFNIEDVVIANFRELDHYETRPPAANVSYCGPVPWTGSGSALPQWPAGAGKRVFVYAKAAYAHAAALLDALAGSGLCCVIYGMEGGGVTLPAGAHNLAFSSQPLDIVKTIAQCDIGICHAGGTTASLLQAGKPMLLLPMHLEQYLEGARVENLGAAVVISPDDKQPDIAGALKRLGSEPGFSQKASAFAEHYRDWTADKILTHVVSRLTAVAKGERLPVPMTGANR